MANDDPENPARWLSDPTGRHEHRSWNGSSWSDDVADDGVTGKDAVSGLGPSAVAPAVAEGEAPTSAAASSPAPTVAEKVWYERKLVWIGAAIIVILVIAGIAGDDTGSGTAGRSNASAIDAPTVAPTTPAVAPTTAAPTVPTVAPTTQAPTPTAPPGPVETPGQSNAHRSAQQYLRLGTGFSRTGLIEQLSSEFGEGFSLEDATYGVDATPTDWRAQACLSAKSYLRISPFSHDGLVEQLSSEFGEGYTPDEAESGVTCAGL